MNSHELHNRPTSTDPTATNREQRRGAVRRRRATGSVALALTMAIGSLAADPAGASRRADPVPAATVPSTALPTVPPVLPPVPPTGSTGTALITVKLRGDVDIDATSARLGLRSYRALIRSRKVYELEVPLIGREATEKDPGAKVVERMKRDQAFSYVESDGTDGPQDERFHAWIDGESRFAGKDASLWLRQPATVDIALQRAQQRTLGQGVTIAVLDTGVTASHPSLVGHIVGGYDYVDDDTNPEETANGIDDDRDGRVDEAYGHGTFVTGIVTLVAPKANVWVARVLDSDGRGSVVGVAEAIHDAVANGATVINMSFGMGDKIKSPALAAAIKEAKDAGVIMIAAAGNDSSDVRFFPASDSGVLAVGASRTGTLRISDFSNFGKWVEVVAPGEQIVSTTPDGFSTWSGTSTAAPFVSGEAALLRSAAPAEKGATLTELIRKSVQKLDRPPELAGGAGRIDIAASLDKLK